MIPKTPTNVKELTNLLKQGEGKTLEFKRSTGELREAMQTVCAFLNGTGGMLLVGVRPDGVLEGQQVSDRTLREIAQASDRFEPPVNLPVEVEVWSAGEFPRGITPALLKRRHLSVQRNPIIADMFHRTGLIEKWGRGTNRVVEMCRAADISPPIFEQIGLGAVVTFRVNVAGTQSEAAPSQHQVSTKSALSQDQVVILRLCHEQKTLIELMSAVRRKDRTKFRTQFLNPLLAMGLIQMTIPDKPNSRLQKYTLTSAGSAAMQQGQEN